MRRKIFISTFYLAIKEELLNVFLFYEVKIFASTQEQFLFLFFFSLSLSIPILFDIFMQEEIQALDRNERSPSNINWNIVAREKICSLFYRKCSWNEKLLPLYSYAPNVPLCSLNIKINCIVLSCWRFTIAWTLAKEEACLQGDKNWVGCITFK